MSAEDETRDLPHPHAATRSGGQLERACAELERRLRAGEPGGAAELLVEFLELARDKHAALELIYTEHVLREERGERPTPEEWYARFPEWEPDLRELFLVKSYLLAAADATETPSFRPSDEPDAVSDSFVRGRRVGDYELLEELGRGGMGVVYKARQVALNREVAVKMIRRADATPAAVARFWVEAEVMAAVKHPHVVQVFELGEYAGQPFMAMELVASGSLAERLLDGPLPPQAAAALLEKIARGVAAAHELGIVHRDLKPANVLLQVAGGQQPAARKDEDTPRPAPSPVPRPPAALTPKVSDFGLAKWRSADLTRTQALMGTPAYMAPEQAAGRAKFVGPPADVWALGVILYECVSGKWPFDGDTPEGLLSQIRSAEPVALRARARGVSRDLGTIVSKCLTKEPEGRYPTAAELADDLGRLGRGEPILARPVGRAERLVRWVRRKPAAAAAYGFSALAVLLALVVFLIAGLWREAESARGRIEDLLGTETTLRGALQDVNGRLTIALQGEEAAKKDVERERAKIARYEYGRTIQVAYQLWKENKIADARRLLTETRPALRGWEYDYVHRLCHADLITFEGHTGWVNSASWSADGSKLVTASHDETARIWDVATGKQLLKLEGHTGLVMFAAFSPDGSKVVTASSEFTARIWDAATGKTLLELEGHTGLVNTASFSPDGSKVVTASYDRTARIWDATTGKRLLKLEEHTHWVNTASFNPDGSKLVTASGDETARIWDAATGKQLLELKGHAGPVHSASFRKDGTQVVTSSHDRTARIWDAATGKQLLELKGHADGVYSASFSPDGSKVVTASRDKTARIWDAATGKQLLELEGHAGLVMFATFNPDGSKVVTAGEDKTVRIWHAATGKTFLELKGHTKPPGLSPFHPSINSASWSADGSKVVTAGEDKTARIWDAATGKQLLELKGHTDGVYSASWSADGSKVVTASRDKTARIWDATAGKTLLKLEGHTDWVKFAAFSRDGSKVVTASHDRSARIWDAATGKTLLELKGHTNWVDFASFSPDESRIVTASQSASQDGTLRVWDTESGAELLALPGVRFASFSQDGSRLITSGLDLSTTIIYDSQPVNRAFIRVPVAPPPRPVGR